MLITVTHHGFVCANAGVDASNAPDDDTVITLPVDPDASARRLRAGLRGLTGSRPAVVITDSFGRAWRTGQCDVAIGCAGLAAARRLARASRHPRTRAARDGDRVADELAAAADLARSKDAMQPAILVRGAGRWVTATTGRGSRRCCATPSETCSARRWREMLTYVAKPSSRLSGAREEPRLAEPSVVGAPTA